jgi:hypothetical protein
MIVKITSKTNINFIPFLENYLQRKNHQPVRNLKEQLSSKYTKRLPAFKTY